MGLPPRHTEKIPLESGKNPSWTWGSKGGNIVTIQKGTMYLSLKQKERNRDDII